jgi:cyclopropane fatty-acyl-phospholipid synthase-like methyltransferase
MSGDEAVWHDVECGAYAEDLPLWEELAGAQGSPILELGCGTGRVALHLARRGFELHGIDSDPALVAALRASASAEDLRVAAEIGDARTHQGPAGSFALAIAAMQLIQLVGGAAARIAVLERVRHALAPGGVVALAIVEGTESVVGAAGSDTVPDVRESGGWLYSSLPTGVGAENGHLQVHRLRQTVSPEGELTEYEHVDHLDVIDAATVEAEGAIAGLVAGGRRTVGESELHVGSTVVLLGREA